MELTETDKLLMMIDLVASFRSLDSKTKLSGKQCKLLEDYIKDLKELIKKVYYRTELNDKQMKLLTEIIGEKYGN